MVNKKNLIVTATDKKFGDFTINHWLKSLKENVNLKNIDIVILDYGMNNQQISELKKQGVIVVKCVRDGHVVLIRFRDMANYIKKNKNEYNQVLLTDGGDVIFQEDLINVFNNNQNKVRVVKETNNLIDFYKVFLNLFKDKYAQDIKKILKGKKMINAGVVFSSASEFVKICDFIFNIITDKTKFGPDQVALNYWLYKEENYVFLNERYNFIPASSKNDFIVKKGVFYFKNGKKISIIHNAGYNTTFRPIKNFGYGPENNKIKKAYLLSIRSMGKVRNNVFKQ